MTEASPPVAAQDACANGEDKDKRQIIQIKNAPVPEYHSLWTSSK